MKSDNDTNFVGAATELKRNVKTKEVFKIFKQ